MSNLEKINVLTEDKLDSLDLTQYPNQIFGTTDEVAEGGGSGGVEPNIITAKLIAEYIPATNEVHLTLPLVEHLKVGSKLTLNSDGGVVIGEGVSKVKVSAIRSIDMGGKTGDVSVTIRKNDVTISSLWIDIKFSNFYSMPCSQASVVVPVSSGDVITMAMWRRNSTVAKAQGSSASIVNGLTVEVIE